VNSIIWVGWSAASPNNPKMLAKDVGFHVVSPNLRVVDVIESTILSCLFDE
jgi:hypothetical protein